ncbi:MAG TPA: outer membrane protein transport protein, partial [Labilithrix sp.]|nr:outer membrane protein transport protein [Labilithrix sp.]
MYYNPAGLARQRGTRLFAGGNLFLHSYEFQRAGSFPDDPNDAATPWGGKPFPVVTNSGGPFFAPFLAASTDFASLDRVTVAVGVFGPPVVGNRTFPLGVRGAPAASRYDYVQSRSTLIYPTASAGFRVTPWLDLGLSAHLVLAKFDQTTVSYGDVGDACKNVEYQPCDSRATLAANATSFGATIGALVRPSPSFAFGLSVRTPISLAAQGTVTPEPPKIAAVSLKPGNATLSTKLPLIVRAGGRYISMDGDFEVYDLELDATFEAWSSAQGDGPRLQIPSLGQFTDIDTLVVHGYSNTFSVRAGGAYNIEALDGVFTLRAGSYFDSAATSFAYTRLDFDTLAKIAGTLGLGYHRGAFGIDVGYAAVASIPRVVGTGQGDVRPINGAKNGKPLDSQGNLLPAVNEGAYRGFTHILAAGITITFDELFGAPRPIKYGNPYERGYVGEDGKAVAPKSENADEKKADEKKADEKKPEPKPEAKPEPKPETKPESKPEPKPEPKPIPKPDRVPEKRHEWWEDLDG